MSSYISYCKWEHFSVIYICSIFSLQNKLILGIETCMRTKITFSLLIDLSFKCHWRISLKNNVPDNLWIKFLIATSQLPYGMNSTLTILKCHLCNCFNQIVKRNISFNLSIIKIILVNSNVIDVFDFKICISQVLKTVKEIYDLHTLIFGSICAN